NPKPETAAPQRRPVERDTKACRCSAHPAGRGQLGVRPLSARGFDSHIEKEKGGEQGHHAGVVTDSTVGWLLLPRCHGCREPTGSKFCPPPYGQRGRHKKGGSHDQVGRSPGGAAGLSAEDDLRL